VLLFALSPVYLVSLLLLFVVGLGSMSHINTGTVVLQLATPRELQGRTMSLWTWGISLSFLGALPVGVLAGRVGAPAAMAGSAALGLLGGAALMLWYAAHSRRARALARASATPEASAAPRHHAG
jgi:hypothetical protein